LEGQSINGKIILKQILDKCGVRIRTGFIWLRTEVWTLVNMVLNLWVP